MSPPTHNNVVTVRYEQTEVIRVIVINNVPIYEKKCFSPPGDDRMVNIRFQKTCWPFLVTPQLLLQSGGLKITFLLRDRWLNVVSLPHFVATGHWYEKVWLKYFEPVVHYYYTQK